MTDGADSVLTQTIWKVETDKDYECQLVVNERELTASVNGQVMNEIKVQPLIIKPAYINVVFDKTSNRYYLKVINFKSQGFNLRLDQEINALQVKQLSGKLTAENTIGQAPQLKRQTTQEDPKEPIRIKGHSVTVIEIKR